MNQQKESKKHFNKKSVIIGAIASVVIILLQANKIEKGERYFEQLQINSQSNTTKIQQQLAIAKILPSLGFRNIVANSTFLSFLQYFSDAPTRTDKSYHLSPEFFDTIITFEPFYRDYYLFLSGSTTFHAAQPEKTVELMDKGLKRIDPTLISDSFYIWRYKAVDELLFLGDSESAIESFEKAALWASQSDRADSTLIKKTSEQTANFLRQDPNSRYAQIAAWESILSNSISADVKKRANQRIQELSSQTDGDILLP